MAESKVFIAYAPFGVGVMCALFYIERGNDVYGWWIGARSSEFHSAYFKLEEFFTTKPTRFYASEGMDLYGGWKYLYSARKPELDKALPVDDAVAHELVRLQGMLAREWLVYEDDADAPAEAEAYARMALVPGHVAIRSRQMGRLAEGQPVFIHRAHGCNMNVIEYLQEHWPLDSRSPFGELIH